MPEKASKDGAEKKRTDSTIDRRDYLKMASGAGATLGSGLSVGALGTGFTSPARAATTIVDDFADTNLSGRYVFDSRGATTNVTSVSSAVTSGADTNVLQMEGDGNTRMHAYEGDSDTDLNAYPEIGETFSCWMRGLNGTENMNVTYGAQDKDNKYYVKLNLETGDVGLFKYVSGSGQSLAGDWGNSTVQNNTSWFKVEIEWKTDHSHTVTVYQNGSQVGSLSYTEDSSDPQFTATGVGYSTYLSSGETVQYDYATKDSNGSNTTSGPSGYCEFDSFENSTLDAYDFDEGSVGDPGAHLVSSPTVEGSQALAISDTTVGMTSTSGLPNYPTAADNTLRYWVQAMDGSENLNVSYGVQTPQDRYYVKLDYDTDWVGLFKLESGSGTSLQGESVSLNSDVWYRVEIAWNSDGIHEITLLEDPEPAIHDSSGTVVAQFSGNDSTWRTGGIGFDAYLQDGETVYFEMTHCCREGGC